MSRSEEGGGSNGAWHHAVSWIKDNGGYVHPDLDYDGVLRQVYLGKRSDAGEATLASEGDTLLLIPDECLVTLHSIEADDSFGKSLFAVVHSLLPDGAAGDGNDGDDVGLFNDAQDVILAIYLAYLRQRLDNTDKQHEPVPWRFYKPYLDTLPSPAESNCHLPRQWPIANLDFRLRGTSLYDRVLKEQRGIKREYELVKTAWVGKHCKGSGGDGTGESGKTTSCSASADLFPSFEHYDTMMAMVTSRGFAGLGFDGVDAMIPMLDLLNHTRGRSDPATDSQGAASDGNRGDPVVSESRLGPDVRYDRYGDDRSVNSEEGSSTKRQRVDDNAMGCRGRGRGVRVSAARPLRSGTALNMTYGAKGNAALLGRYGFCIPNNVEPDGSCNDVLEITVKQNEPAVKLQRGPKSYSYGPFVKALDLCRVLTSENNCTDGCDARLDVSDEREDENGGLEAFLDSCDNEFDGSGDDEDEEYDEIDDLGDCLYGPSANLNANRGGAASSTLTADLHAVDVLESILNKANDALRNNPLAKLLNWQNQTNGSKSEVSCTDENELREVTDDDRYCAMLIDSEAQTVHFYLAAVTELRRQLLSKTGSASNRDYQSKSNVIREQVNALVAAFLSIRYPDTSS